MGVVGVYLPGKNYRWRERGHEDEPGDCSLFKYGRVWLMLLLQLAQ